MADKLAKCEKDAASPKYAHHPIFSHYQSPKDSAPADMWPDFIGTHTHRQYVKDPFSQLIDGYPQIGEEYLEWIDLLKSVAEANDRYVFCELGAGYGRWAARAYLAAKQKGISKIKLITVEGEPTHSSWLVSHLAVNGVLPNEIDHYECAISDKNGLTHFYISMPEGNAGNTPREWYGQCRLGDWDKIDETASDTGQKYQGKSIIKTASGYGAVNVSQRRASELLGKYELIDLINMDIQGEEVAVIADAIEYLNNHVKRLHIGTHGAKIETALRDILSANAWICVNDYPCQSTSETPYGVIEFTDGIQTWINSRKSAAGT